MERHQEKRKIQRGFTLIEFLLIIAVVGALLGVAFLIYSNVKKSSDAQSWADKGRTFLASMQSYVRDKGGTYPTATCDSSTAWDSGECANLKNYIGNSLVNEGWQYVCSSGGNPSIKTPVISDAEIGFQVAQKLANFGSSDGWDCTYDATNKQISCTNTNVTCP